MATTAINARINAYSTRLLTDCFLILRLSLLKYFLICFYPLFPNLHLFLLSAVVKTERPHPAGPQILPEPTFPI